MLEEQSKQGRVFLGSNPSCNQWQKKDSLNGAVSSVQGATKVLISLGGRAQGYDTSTSIETYRTKPCKEQVS